MVRRRTRRNRTMIWLTVLLIFVVLLVLANESTNGERFYGVAPITTIFVALAGLVALQIASADHRAWKVTSRQLLLLIGGTVLHVAIAHLFNHVLKLSTGPVMIQPQICIPVFFGYAFGPVVGFFTGAVGSLLGDFLAGWGVFPAWAIAGGLTGLVPGLAMVFADKRRHQPGMARLIILLVGGAAVIVFAYPAVPSPWTGAVRNHIFWGWALIIAGAVVLANRALFEQVGTILAAVNVWGALGIIAGNLFAALTHIWINEYTAGTALVGEFAPTTATDMLNLIVFSPLILAVYNSVHLRLTRRYKEPPPR